jgi:hypothetical protein
MAADSNVELFGTSEAPDVLRRVLLGPLSFLYTSDAIRSVCWHRTELVRAIAWPMRDENWVTYAPMILDETIEADDDRFEGHLRFAVGDGRLECALTIQASSAGDVRLDLSMTPKKGPFATNRAGFTVLHPIKGIAGAQLEVTHSGGTVEHTEFPQLISPGQPVFNIHGLKYELDGKAVDIAFAGDIFEMEDQRNWSDASYKTYCVPLVFPFTYEIKGAKSQSIQMALSGKATGDAGVQAEPSLTWQRTEDVAPGIGLAIEHDWLGEGAAIALSGIGHLCARVWPDTQDSDLRALASAAEGLDLNVEVVIADADDPATGLAAARQKIKGAGLGPSRVVALREGYLGSYQPSGRWPDGPVPPQVVEAARSVFSSARIGGGMLTNFTEFNRCQPKPALCDFVTHGSTAIVHAGDDLSVCETLEALPQIFESALAIAEGKPYRLGLVSIGMRSNPYGAAVAENPTQVRRTMAREDPRQRGLFGAAWAVGVLAATQGHAVEALCLGAPTGPFGIAYCRQPYPQIYFDETPGAAIYPIFHVVKTAARMAGEARLHVSGMPDRVYAYGVDTGSGPTVMVANVSPETKTVSLGYPGRVAILDHSTFNNATCDADWLKTAARHDSEQLRLEGFAVAFVQN